LELGKHTIDKELLDRHGRRAGKVDDLLLEVPEPGNGELPRPEVVALITGPSALSRNLPRPLAWLAHQCYRLLGLAHPHPVEIPWNQVIAIDVVVHADIDRDEAGVTALQQSVERFISRIPGS
jgi:hypothetical protein